MMTSNWIFGFTAALLLSACSLTPTKIYNSEAFDSRNLEKGSENPIQITEETVILDARAPFDFAVAHLPQAVNIQWKDFADLNGPFPGRLKSDLSPEVRRLSLIGVNPKTPVVVLGRGVEGRGEEGRLAWTLLYLGVENVQTAEADSLGLRYSNLVPPPRPNAPTWVANPRISILASKKEVIAAATTKFNDRLHILDVRSTNEFFSKNTQLRYEYPDLRAVNIEWKEFFTSKGRPNLTMRKQLKSINISPEDRIIVISNNGVRSAAVTYALLALGYKKAANYAGGYAELVGIRK